MELDDRKILHATPRIGKGEEQNPRKGTCYYCKAIAADLCILSWNGSDRRYEGACPECAKHYLDEQTVGGVIREEEQEKFEAIRRRYSSDIRDHVYFMDGGGEGFWI